MNMDWFAKLEWSNKKIPGKDQSFDELFNIEGISLWWFYHRFFVPWVMPKKINLFNEMNEKRTISRARDMKLSFTAKILAKGLYHSEKRKIKKFEKRRENKKSVQKPNALLLSYTNHISNDNKIFRYQQILNELSLQKQVGTFLLFADPLSKRTHKSLQKQNTIYDYFTHQINTQAKDFARKTYQHWQSLTKRQKEQMLTIEGNNYWQYVKHGFSLYMSKEFLYLLYCYYEIFKSAIRQENGKVCLVTGVSSLHERCLMAAAKFHGIRTIFVEHGLLLHGTATNPKIIHDTKMAVFSENFKQKFVDVGLQEDQIEVVGPVVYDEIYKYMKPKEDTKKRLFIATSPIVEINYCEKQKYFSRVKILLEKVSNKNFDEIIIKLHPREINLQEYENAAKELGLTNIKVLRDISRDEYYRLINESDYFIHFGSNSSIEAIILDKPVLLVNMLEDKRLTSWVEEFKIMPIVSFKDDISKELGGLEQDRKMRDKRRREFVAKYIGKVDGLASKRVVQLIVDTVSKRK